MTPNLPTLLTRIADELSAETDPDGTSARQALLLAVHVGMAQPAPGSPDWDLYTVAIGDAEAMARNDHDAPMLLLPEVAEFTDLETDDSPETRDALTTLVRRLADLYATAAKSETGSPWRRLLWARVAHRLDDAANELTS